ncbi:hypothetical protein R3W88_019801 [Solanum pinnatisectum]|uniref:Uncharacterized protein n=1 Tax=Solanum pinnatisectum TaxID=50273 RepID=A0AAV9KKP4_9SOLN|nr:hypothetical protein R3W88_019801 [Solanum pinnatisectum]
MICLGSPQYFTTFLKNNRAASLAVQPAVAGTKVAYFENLSTTTMMVPYPLDLGKEVMKSMVTLSHGRFATGSGSSSPPGCLCSTLSCWHTRQVYT